MSNETSVEKLAEKEAKGTFSEKTKDAESGEKTSKNSIDNAVAESKDATVEEKLQSKEHSELKNEEIVDSVTNADGSGTKEANSESESLVEEFDFNARLDGPQNMSELCSEMKLRNIENSADLDFDVEFVEQFYNDQESVAGEQKMYNGEPEDWGQTYWDFIHFVAYYYPETPSDSVKRATFQQLDAFRETLPCENCRRAFRLELLELPLDQYLDSRESLIEWSIELHSRVNKRLGKSVFDVDKTYTRLLERSKQKKNSNRPKSNLTTHSDPNLVMVSRSKVKQKRNSSARESTSTTTQKAEADSKRQLAAPQIAAREAQRRALQQKRSEEARRRVSAQQSTESVRQIMQRRSQLNSRQRAALVKNDRQKAARRVKKPKDCASCKPMTPSSF